MLFNKEQVLDYLPHRDPFLFIDAVKEIIVPDEIKGRTDLVARDVVGTKVICEYTVTEDMFILKGHFPGNPILPGVIQIEMIAQASAFSSLPINNLSTVGLNVETLLLGVEQSRFRKPITPGMKLEIHATMTKCRGTVASY